jgi:PIN domain nuclease of toxin-antitoxin system
LSQLIARAEAGEEVIIARGKAPLTRLVPFQPPAAKRRFGLLRPPARGRARRLGSVEHEAILDTHTFLWWLASGGWPLVAGLWWLGGDSGLSDLARMNIADESNAVFVSAVSAWEIATKHGIGKLPGAAGIVHDIEAAILDQGFATLPIILRHGQVAGGLPGPHRDPFDRMLIAQAMIEDLILVTNERPFDVYGVTRIW